MDVLEQNTYKRRYSDKGCDFLHKKTLFSQINAVFYEEKLFFALFFEKRAIFRKKSRPEKSRRKLKSTSDLVRSREFKRLFRPILCAPKCIFLESQSIFIPISQKF